MKASTLRQRDANRDHEKHEAMRRRIVDTWARAGLFNHGFHAAWGNWVSGPGYHFTWGKWDRAGAHPEITVVDSLSQAKIATIDAPYTIEEYEPRIARLGWHEAMVADARDYCNAITNWLEGRAR